MHQSKSLFYTGVFLFCIIGSYFSEGVATSIQSPMLESEDILKHVKTILELNPDTEEEEVVAFMHLMGYGQEHLDKLLPKLREYEKDAKTHTKKHSARHRKHVCIKEVTQLYKKNPSMSEDKVQWLVELYTHEKIKGKVAKRCVAGLHKGLNDKSRVLPVQSSKTRKPTRARSALWSHIKKYIGKLLTELENHVLQGAAGPRGEKGDKGDQGEVGDQGPRGKQGERGEKGDKGDTGKPGEAGEDGEKGEKGDVGPQGEKGDKGDRGERGDEGVGLHLQEWKLGRKYVKGDYVFMTVVDPKTKEKFDVMFICSHPIEAAKKLPQDDLEHWVHFEAPRGERGEEGPKGEKGDRGHVGPKGEKGDIGNRGAQGEKGDRGERGEKGPRGKEGKVGPQGDKGDRGERGEVGADGEVGKQGPVGPKGDIGNIGPQGAKGERGDRGVKGDKGNSGDGLKLRTFKLGHHYRVADYVIYRPKGKEHDIMYIAVAKFKAKTTPDRDLRNWSPFHAPRGPKGDKGDRGEDGKQGVRGPGGPRGPKGARGAQGFMGRPGPIGSRGKIGLIGKPGPIGKRGPRGVQGPPGPRGLKGDRGNNGGPGPRGPAGPQGPQGPQGHRGHRGGKRL